MTIITNKQTIMLMKNNINKKKKKNYKHVSQTKRQKSIKKTKHMKID